MPVFYGAGQLPGTQTNDNANAGNVGEYISSTIAIGSSVSLTTGTAANVTSISLTPGDWDIRIHGHYSSATTTSINYMWSSISTTTATASATAGFFNMQQYGTGLVLTNVGAGVSIVDVPPIRVSVSSTTTYFFVAKAGFTVSTCNVYGVLEARRVR